MNMNSSYWEKYMGLGTQCAFSGQFVQGLPLLNDTFIGCNLCQPSRAFASIGCAFTS